MDTCKRWGLTSKNIGVYLATKIYRKEQFKHLAQIQQEVGQVSYLDMHLVGIPRGKFLHQ